jgi:hypothetical protein
MKLIVSISAILGAIVGGFMLYIGFQHNPQMEFFDTATGRIDYSHSLLLFSLWFAVIFVPLVVVGWLGVAITKR